MAPATATTDTETTDTATATEVSAVAKGVPIIKGRGATKLQYRDLRPTSSLGDLFLKTKAQPSIFWLPHSDAEAAAHSEARRRAEAEEEGDEDSEDETTKRHSRRGDSQQRFRSRSCDRR